MSRVEEIREVVETVVNGEHNNVYRNLCKAMKAYSVEELTELHRHGRSRNASRISDTAYLGYGCC